MTSSLIRGKYVICRVIDDNTSEIIEDGAVYQEDGQIIEIGRYSDLKAHYEPDEMKGNAGRPVIGGRVYRRVLFADGRFRLVRHDRDGDIPATDSAPAERGPIR